MPAKHARICATGNEPRINARKENFWLKKNISSSFLYVCACDYGSEWAHL